MAGIPLAYPNVAEHKVDLSKDFPPEAGSGSGSGAGDEGPPPAYFPPDLGPNQQNIAPTSPSHAPPGSAPAASAPSAPRNNLDLPELPSIPMDSPARGKIAVLIVSYYND